MSVHAVNVLHPLVQIILLGIEMSRVGGRRRVASLLSVRVRRENLGEGVSHLQLPIESSVEVSGRWIETAVLDGALRSRRQRIIDILVGQSCLEVRWVLCQRRRVPVVILLHLG